VPSGRLSLEAKEKELRWKFHPRQRTLFLRCTKTHAGPGIIQEFDARLLQRTLDQRERAGARPDLAVETFHAPDCSNRDPRTLCEIDLFHADERASRAQLPSCDQLSTVTRPAV